MGQRIPSQNNLSQLHNQLHRRFKNPDKKKQQEENNQLQKHLLQLQFTMSEWRIRNQQVRNLPQKITGKAILPPKKESEHTSRVKMIRDN